MGIYRRFGGRELTLVCFCLPIVMVSHFDLSSEDRFDEEETRGKGKIMGLS